MEIIEIELEAQKSQNIYLREEYNKLATEKAELQKELKDLKKEVKHLRKKKNVDMSNYSKDAIEFIVDKLEELRALIYEETFFDDDGYSVVCESDINAQIDLLIKEIRS